MSCTRLPFQSWQQNELGKGKDVITSYSIHYTKLYETEFQKLEIELSEKRIKEATIDLKNKKDVLDSSKTLIDERKADLAAKKKELDEIVNETQNEEERLIAKAKEIEQTIPERLTIAFKRIRKNARNGLALVTVERDACGGCFNKIVITSYSIHYTKLYETLTNKIFGDNNSQLRLTFRVCTQNSNHIIRLAF